MSIEHPDITCALATGYATFSQPASEPTELDREEFVKDNAGLVVLWMLGNYREVLEEYIQEHEAQFRAWMN